MALSIAAPGSAAPPAPGPELVAQRQRFLAAERALRAGARSSAYQRLRAGLQDYPLYPYLLYAELSRQPGARDTDRIKSFVRRFADTPLAARLRSRWLLALAAQGRWRQLLAHDDPGARAGTRLRCQRLRAYFETGERERAFAGVPELWMVGHSQPSECDPVFRAWIASEPRIGDLAWERLTLAMAAGEHGLARYLRGLLDTDDRDLARQWSRRRRDPRQLRALLALDASREHLELVLGDLLGRHARRDPEQAEESWRDLRAGFDFSAATSGRIMRALVRGYASREEARGLWWADRLAAAEIDEPTHARAIVLALVLGKWQRALDQISRLGVEDARRPRWRYWRARALEASGKPADAAGVYATLARGRGYYSFLAADRAGLDYAFSDRETTLPATALDQMERRPAMRRASELLALGRRVAARREWRDFVSRLSATERITAAKLAQRWGWHGRAILTAARSQARDDLTLRFPLAHRVEVERVAAQRRLDPAWLFAVVRQESAFIVDARSPRGALGLMQVMPRTGRAVARKLGRKWTGHRALLRPEVSLSIGSAYLQQLMARLGKRRLLVTAAYNAGPHRVQRWLPRTQGIDGDLWVETIPFGETRDYVRRVLSYTAVYQYRLGRQPSPVGAHLARVEPRGER